MGSQGEGNPPRTILPSAEAGATAPPSLSAMSEAPATGTASSEAPLPPRIGAYRPLRLLGEGGMGVVYEAEQVRPRRVVALKVIRPILISPQSLRRFEVEAEILGRLQHPGIAQIYEAGTADTGFGPQPYFAMELVRGPRLDRYAAEKQLSTRQRVELLIRICDAVQYAHQRGVIHRDLKPGNILVDESGQPKILDFGVARITDADVQAATIQPTHTGQLLGTLQYMAPEQARGDVREIDTAADVYALGVIAYELLGGRPPYVLSKTSLPEAVRIICDDEPSRLSVIDRSFRGDLETIIRKSLEKDKTRRYQAISSFAADLRRYLNNEPIAARPPSTFYQVRKFAARHRALTTGIVALIVLLIAGLAGSLIALNRIRLEQRRTLTQKQAAEEAGAQSDAVNRFLQSMLKSAHPAEAQGHEPTVEEVLNSASQRVGTELKDQPLVEAAVRYTIGDSYWAMGKWEPAAAHFREVMEIYKRLKGPDSPGAIQSQNMLATCLQAMGKYEEAEMLSRDALDRSTRVLGPDNYETIVIANDLAILLAHSGKVAEAEPLHRDVIERQKRKLGPDHPEVLSSVISFSFVLTKLGKDAESEAMLREALPHQMRLKGPDHPDTLTIMQGLGINLMKLKKLDEAAPLLREALDRRRKVLGPEHPDTLETMSQLGVLLARAGHDDEGLALQHDALEKRRKIFGDNHPATLASERRLAQTMASLNQKPATTKSATQP